MKKRILPLVLCLFLVGILLSGCGGNGSLSLPDGKKLLSDALSKTVDPDYSTVKMDMAFEMDVAGQKQSMAMKMDGTGTKERSIIGLDIAILGQEYDDTFYSDAKEGAFYFKGSDGTWYTYTSDDFSMGAMFESGTSQQMDPQSIAQLQLLSKEIKTEKVITVDDHELYQIHLILDGENLFNMVIKSMGDTSSMDEKDLKEMKTMMVKMFEAFDIYFYVEVSGGRFGGFSMEISESFIEAMKESGMMEGATDMPDTFSLKMEMYNHYGEKTIAFPDETRNAVPIQTEEELMEKMPIMQYLEGIDQMMNSGLLPM